LGEVLGRDARWAGERRNELVRRGLVRVLTHEEIPAKLHTEHELVEATVRGLTMLAGSMGMSLDMAVRHHGLAGGGPATTVGPRRALLAHLAHTLGADGVFAKIARAAGGQRNGALLEWRNAAACAHGRMRPDGYGLVRLGRREYGFFLEFDRGTIRPAALRAKFAAYQRYRSSTRAARGYEGFPTILVVTTGPGAEERLTHAVRAAEAGQTSPLPLLLTTVRWIEAHPQGVLGSIWRTPESRSRHAWPTPNGGRGGLGA
jgi:hypothetical protein